MRGMHACIHTDSGAYNHYNQKPECSTYHGVDVNLMSAMGVDERAHQRVFISWCPLESITHQYFKGPSANKETKTRDENISKIYTQLYSTVLLVVYTPLPSPCPKI